MQAAQQLVCAAQFRMQGQQHRSALRDGGVSLSPMLTGSRQLLVAVTDARAVKARHS
jgi:hypothetical protein